MSTAHKSQEKKPCEPIAKSKPTRGSPKKSSSSGHKSTTIVCATEPDHKRNLNISSPQESPKERLKREISLGDRKKKVNSKELADTTAYWNEQLREQLLSRKKEVVDRFMAAITECLDRKLEPFEEPCDGEGCAASSSHGSSKSSTGKHGGSSKRQIIGKRRDYQRDDDEGHESDNDDGGQRNDNNKRSKTVPERDKMYACPYFKYAPEVFGTKRTCSGPGWHELHRLKEHITRSHKLPEYACPRCCEPFTKAELMNNHLRADVPCKRKHPTPNGARNLADGYDKEQGELLKKKRTGPCHDKWIGWYCILFDKDPESPDIPSPYHGVPAASNWNDGHTHRPKYGNYIAVLRRETLNRVRTLFETELDKALHGLQPMIRNNVLARIPSVADSVQRIVQSDPEYSGMVTPEGESSSLAIPSDLDPTQLFEPRSFLESFDPTNLVPGDAFDFGFLHNQDQIEGQAYQPYTDYSSSYMSDDLNGASQSSHTSVEEHHNDSAKNQGGQPTVVMPQQLSMPPSDPYTQPYY